MADIGWRRRRGSSPAARRGARQRAGLTPASASNTLSCQRETLHSQQLKSIKKSIDSDHGIYRYTIGRERGSRPIRSHARAPPGMNGGPLLYQFLPITHDHAASGGPVPNREPRNAPFGSGRAVLPTNPSIYGCRQCVLGLSLSASVSV
jgi:hypothetical protein